MINVEDQYFSLSRTFLLLIGLWPYQKLVFVRFQSICFFSLSTIFIIFQLIPIVTLKPTIDIVINILSIVFATINIMLIYNSFYINSDTVSQAVMYLMEQLKSIYNDIKDKNEIAIVEEYGNNAKRYTNGLLIIFIGGICIHMFAQFWQSFLSNILSTDKSQARHMPAEFIYQEKYFFLWQLHISIAIYLGVFVVIATGITLIAFFKHSCGMFKIASYRIENAMQIHILQDINPQKETFIYKGIICAVDIHRKAMKFCSYVVNKMEISFMFLIILGVITLSCNLFRIFQLISQAKYTLDQLLIPVLIGSLCAIYMFLSNLCGQEIINHNNDVYATAYNVCWYAAPLHIQKLLLLLLQRGKKPFGLNIGGLFIASLESFALLVKASVSYFTVMYSVQD